jgi:signal transduction histidine kinase/AmiR/NasT family two-component response regulator
MKNDSGFMNFFFPVFYAVAFLFVVFNAWNIQSEAKRSSGPLYKNLREVPAYAKRGFNSAELGVIPDESKGWVRFPSAPTGRRIRNSNLPDLPKRTYLSPFGKPSEEFTITFLIEVDNKDLALMNGDVSTHPGFFFAGVGENWEFFFNGKSVHSEMHLDTNGKVKERRVWRDVHFPVDGLLFVQGTNILTLRVLGDPAFNMTGPFYSTAPIYMEDYKVIEKRQYNFLLIVLGGICIFAGVYYILLFFSIKNKKEIFNLYFGIFSILLCVYAVARNGMVHNLIPNSDVTIRLEYFSLILMIPMFGLFIETLLKGKITIITMCYLTFCSLLAITVILFCNQYEEEVIIIWDLSAMIYYSYIIIYDIIYFLFWGKHKEEYKGKGIQLDMSIGSILIGTIGSYFCGLFDIFDILFIRSSLLLFQYSIFVINIGMVFALSQRFSGMYKRMEQSNALLEIAVQERTKELEEQTKIALQASKAKSDFLATMSHEIRTPLNAVIGLSEIELRGNLPEPSMNNITQIYQSGSSLLGIINDILDISKIEAGAFDLIPVEYETAPFIDDTVNLNRVRIGSKPISFILEIEGDFPRKLFGDELRVKQILNNLLSNAVKYTERGTVTFSAMAFYYNGKNSPVKNENEVLLSFIVRDTGIGIQKKDMEKLFTVYTQLDSKINRKVEGTGLGLEITKKLVDMMNGTITAESEYGKGSVFTVTLIQKLADFTGIGEETAINLRNFQYVAGRKQDEIVPCWMPNGKVLVVDDVPVNIMVVEGLLEPYGVHVDSAYSGKEAIEKITNEDPNYDLVFMDHMMPGMDGIEAVRIIREWEEQDKQKKKKNQLIDRIPIIALTANALAGNMEMFMAEGFDGFISKPIDVVEIDLALNRWVRNKQSQDNLK